MLLCPDGAVGVPDPGHEAAGDVLLLAPHLHQSEGSTVVT